VLSALRHPQGAIADPPKTVLPHPLPLIPSTISPHCWTQTPRRSRTNLRRFQFSPILFPRRGRFQIALFPCLLAQTVPVNRDVNVFLWKRLELLRTPPPLPPGPLMFASMARPEPELEVRLLKDFWLSVDSFLFFHGFFPSSPVSVSI